MGLLDRAARGTGRFISGARSAMGRRADPLNFTDNRFAPLSSAAAGALGGGFVGSVADQENPGRGALMGAGLGALGGGGISLARQGGAALKGGMNALREPRQVATELVTLAEREGPEAASAQFRQLSQTDPDLASEVMEIIRAGHMQPYRGQQMY